MVASQPGATKQLSGAVLGSIKLQPLDRGGEQADRSVGPFPGFSVCVGGGGPDGGWL